MIIGIGTDIVNIARIERLMHKHETRFIERHFSVAEQKAAEKYKDDHDAYIRFFAKRFAAKEATAKAMGTGFRDGLYLKDISVTNDALGKPHLEFSGGALDILKNIAPESKDILAHLSLSDDPPIALAYVVLEAKQPILT